MNVGGNAHEMRRRGAAQRAAFVALCEKAIATNTPMPHTADIVRLCGMSSPGALSTRLNQLATSGDVFRVRYKPGGAPVYRMRDGRVTPSGMLRGTPE